MMRVYVCPFLRVSFYVDLIGAVRFLSDDHNLVFWGVRMIIVIDSNVHTYSYHNVISNNEICVYIQSSLANMFQNNLSILLFRGTHPQNLDHKSWVDDFDRISSSLNSWFICETMARVSSNSVPTNTMVRWYDLVDKNSPLCLSIKLVLFSSSWWIDR